MNTAKLIMNKRDARPLYDDRYGTTEGAVWETAGPATGLLKLSFAHAIVAPGKILPAHFHEKMSECYHILSGNGTMQLNGVKHTVGPGDTISLPPKTIHSLLNTGNQPIHLLVATAPAYTTFSPPDDIEV